MSKARSSRKHKGTAQRSCTIEVEPEREEVKGVDLGEK